MSKTFFTFLFYLLVNLNFGYASDDISEKKVYILRPLEEIQDFYDDSGEGHSSEAKEIAKFIFKKFPENDTVDFSGKNLTGDTITILHELGIKNLILFGAEIDKAGEYLSKSIILMEKLKCLDLSYTNIPAKDMESILEAMTEKVSKESLTQFKLLGHKISKRSFHLISRLRIKNKSLEVSFDEECLLEFFKKKNMHDSLCAIGEFFRDAKNMTDNNQPHF